VSAQVVEAGKEAWKRIRSNQVTSFGDWLAIGGALIALRAEAMRQVGCNRPYGPSYQVAIRAKLALHGLQDVDSHERRNAIQCFEHKEEIELWRQGLSDAERRRCCHVSTNWTNWRRNTKPSERSGPRPKWPTQPQPALARATDGPPEAIGKIVHMPGEHIRRAAMALRQNARNADCFVVAKLVLEAAFRTDFAMLGLYPCRRS
jgi:hypothetical protein